MDTMGAPHSSAAATHWATESFSVMVDLYSRMRPQPVHVRLQACNGSSIMTSGNFSIPCNRFPARYPVRLAVSVNGNRNAFTQSVNDGRFTRSPENPDAPDRPANAANPDNITRDARVDKCPISCQSGERKRLSVQVILQIEHLRKARACRGLFLPCARGILRIEQVLDGPNDGGLG